MNLTAVARAAAAVPWVWYGCGGSGLMICLLNISRREFGSAAGFSFVAAKERETRSCLQRSNHMNGSLVIRVTIPPVALLPIIKDLESMLEINLAISDPD
jgi:hypothetical protein